MGNKIHKQKGLPLFNYHIQNAQTNVMFFLSDLCEKSVRRKQTASLPFRLSLSRSRRYLSPVVMAEPDLHAEAALMACWLVSPCLLSPSTSHLFLLRHVRSHCVSWRRRRLRLFLSHREEPPNGWMAASAVPLQKYVDGLE